MILALIFSMMFFVSCNNSKSTPVLPIPNNNVQQNQEDIEDIKEVAVASDLRLMALHDEDSLKTESLLSLNQHYLSGIYNYLNEVNLYVKANILEDIKNNAISFYEVKEDGVSKNFILKFSHKLSEDNVKIYRVNDYLNIEEPVVARLILINSEEYSYKLSLKNMKKGVYIIQVENLSVDNVNESEKIVLPSSFKFKFNHSHATYVCDGAKLKVTKESYYLSPTHGDREFPVKEIREMGRRGERRLVVIGSLVNRSRGSDIKRKITTSDLLKFIKINNSPNVGYGLGLLQKGDELVFKSNNELSKCDFVKIEVLDYINRQNMRVGTISFMGNPIGVGEVRDKEHFEISRFIEVFDSIQLNGEFQVY